jgi:DNA polymerase III delta subunit
MVSHYLELTEKGVADNRRVAAELGIHPFFVSRIQGQAKHQTPERLFRAIDLLAECDFRLKTGEGSLFEFFLARYFSS